MNFPNYCECGLKKEYVNGRFRCVPCIRLVQKKYREAEHGKYKAVAEKSTAARKEKLSKRTEEQKAIDRKHHADKRRERYHKDKQFRMDMLRRSKEWTERNKEEINAYNRTYHKKKRQEAPPKAKRGRLTEEEKKARRRKQYAERKSKKMRSKKAVLMSYLATLTEEEKLVRRREQRRRSYRKRKKEMGGKLKRLTPWQRARIEAKHAK